MRRRASKYPLLLLVSVCVTPVPTLVTLTVAPGMTPCSSRTVPEMVLLVSCAIAGMPVSNNKKPIIQNFRIQAPL